MNEINISEDRFKEAKTLSHACSSTQLRKVGHITFGLCDREDGALRFAFASAELVSYLETRIDKKITDVQLLHQSPILGDEANETKVLRLRFDDAKIAILDKYDHIYEFEPFVSENERSILTSPHKQWGLPAHGIYAAMLLTERMINTIEDIADEGQHAYLVSILWKEYRLTTESLVANEFDRICVEGEFMSFSVKRFAHGLFIFDYA